MGIRVIRRGEFKFRRSAPPLHSTLRQAPHAYPSTYIPRFRRCVLSLSLFRAYVVRARVNKAVEKEREEWGGGVMNGLGARTDGRWEESENVQDDSLVGKKISLSLRRIGIGRGVAR